MHARRVLMADNNLLHYRLLSFPIVNMEEIVAARQSGNVERNPLACRPCRTNQGTLQVEQTDVVVFLLHSRRGESLCQLFPNRGEIDIQDLAGRVGVGY